MRRIAVLDAPSNLGLRPPTASSVPGCAKAPGALRDNDLVAALGARDAGCLTPPRYDPGDWRPGDGVCHANEIVWYSRALADRLGVLLDAGEFPLVLGGDCSVSLGSALALARMSTRDELPYGLVYVDGHSDFRHPGNASYVGAAGGESLALLTGRGQPDLTNMEGLRPYVRDEHVVLLGIRGHDEHRLDLQAAGITYRAVPQLRVEGPARTAQWARDQLSGCVGYWVHVDVDVLDPAVMPAVDAPDPGGIAYVELQLLIAGLVASPDCLGLEITVFDPDYDLERLYARELTDTLVGGLAALAGSGAVGASGGRGGSGGHGAGAGSGGHGAGAGSGGHGGSGGRRGGSGKATGAEATGQGGGGDGVGGHAGGAAGPVSARRGVSMPAQRASTERASQGPSPAESA